MKLLIIEDEPDLLASLIKGFKKNGYAVDGSEDGAEGLELYKINEYDLIILDRSKDYGLCARFSGCFVGSLHYGSVPAG